MRIEALLAARAEKRLQRQQRIDAAWKLIENLDQDEMLEVVERIVAYVNHGPSVPEVDAPDEETSSDSDADVADALDMILGTKTIRQLIVECLAGGPPKTTGELFVEVKKARPGIVQNTVGAEVKRLKDKRIIFQSGENDRHHPRYALTSEGRREWQQMEADMPKVS